MSDDSPEARHNLSHNLAREWVTAELQSMRWPAATVQSEWVGEGVAFPQTSGEHNDPTAVAPPDWIDIHITVPSSTTEDAMEGLLQALDAAASADPYLGGRFDTGHFEGQEGETERVESLDQGANAQRLTVRLSVQGPRSPMPD